MTTSALTDNIKCVVVGDNGVGKTSMIMSYVKYTFPKEVPNVFEPCIVTVTYEKKCVKFTIVDTDGSEECDETRPKLYENVDVFMIAFSLDDPTSFEHVKSKWYPEIKKHHRYVSDCENNELGSTTTTSTENKGTPPIIIIGNKLDEREDSHVMRDLSGECSGVRPVTRMEGEKIAKEMLSEKISVAYYEISSKTQKGVKEALNAVVSECVLHRKEEKKKKGEGKCRIM